MPNTKNLSIEQNRGRMSSPIGTMKVSEGTVTNIINIIINNN